MVTGVPRRPTTHSVCDVHWGSISVGRGVVNLGYCLGVFKQVAFL